MRKSDIWGRFQVEHLVQILHKWNHRNIHMYVYTCLETFSSNTTQVGSPKHMHTRVLKHLLNAAQVEPTKYSRALKQTPETKSLKWTPALLHGRN